MARCAQPRMNTWRRPFKDDTKIVKGVNMFRLKIAVVALMTLTATVAPAGELKIHNWPCAFIPQEIPGVEIPVLMDVGYWVDIVNQNGKIKLQQVNIHTYEGCLDLQVKCNFDLTLSCAIHPTNAIPGSYSCSISNADIDAPGGIATLCARLTKANLGGQPGGTKNVKVAVVTLKVVPR
jgi:hypothetical protein